MKKLITALAFCVSALTFEKACADWHDGYHDGYVVHEDFGSHEQLGNSSKSSLELSVGYRTDDLNFRIGSPTQNPDTLSKVHFDELRIYQFGATYRGNFCECYYFRGDASVGGIYSGKSRVTNFNCFCDGENRNDHRFNRKTGRGEVWDISGGFGYQICACDNALKFIPLIGYSWNELRVRRFGPVHGFARQQGNDCSACDDSFDDSFFGTAAAQPATSLAKSSSNYNDDSGNFIDDNSNGRCFHEGRCPNANYRARWNGPWVGFDLAYNFNCNLDLYGSFEYHWLHFNGRGHWNLRDEFVDNFSQGANGNGQTYLFGLNYHWLSCFDVGVEVEFKNWYTRRGHDRSYFNSNLDSHCDRPEITYNRLNFVNWNSVSVSGTVGYDF